MGQAKTVFAHAPAARRCAIARPMRPRSGTRGALLQTQRACVCRATAEQEPRDCGVSAAGRRHRRGQDRGDCAARPAPTAPAQGRRRVVPRCGEVLHREGALLTPPPPRARARRAAASEPSGCVGGALASLRRVPRARAVSARGEAHRRKRAHCALCKYVSILCDTGSPGSRKAHSQRTWSRHAAGPGLRQERRDLHALPEGRHVLHPAPRPPPSCVSL